MFDFSIVTQWFDQLLQVTLGCPSWLAILIECVLVGTAILVGYALILNAYLSADKNYIIVVASRNSSNTEFGLYRLDSNPANPILEFLDKGRVSLEKDRYVVSAGSRVATYDINGNKMSGLSSTEFENMPQPKVEAPVRQEVKKKEPIPDLPPREKVTEQIRPTIDLAPKTKVEVPERPNIKPVDVPTSGK